MSIIRKGVTRYRAYWCADEFGNSIPDKTPIGGIVSDQDNVNYYLIGGLSKTIKDSVQLNPILKSILLSYPDVYTYDSSKKVFKLVTNRLTNTYQDREHLIKEFITARLIEVKAI